GLADGGEIRVYNERGEFRARALVTDRIPAGAVWMGDGWEGLNRLTAGGPCIPDAAVDMFAFGAGQASFDAMVEVAPAEKLFPTKRPPQRESANSLSPAQGERAG